MPRGGKRPGAGAPRGNLNALKSGAYSPRFFDGLLLFGLVPEAKPIYLALKRRDRRKYRRLLYETIAAAYHAAHDDPSLALAINDLVAGRIEAVARRAEKMKSQSVNQTRSAPPPKPPGADSNRH